ncbi:MAG: hypothetical protein QOF18_2637 [Frankiaceae bacterium]|jgi:glycosyltransferase involved in cell wall biosynthesis|nr:hypothetical protein [Frankiaceae bacterium]
MTGPPIRVLHVMGGAAVGGIERQLLLLLPRLKPATEPHVVLLRGGPLQGSFGALVPTEVIPKFGKVDPVCLARLVASMRRHRPDVVHTWGSTANLWGSLAARLAGMPRIVVSDGAIDAWKGRLLRKADAVLYGWADTVTGNSAAVVEASVQRGAWPARARVISNGVEVPATIASRGDRDPGTLLFLGRMHPDKGPDLMVEAFRSIAVERPDLRLVMAGAATQPVERQLERTVRDAVNAAGLADRVEFTGPVDDPSGWLRRAAVLVLPSRTEGSPNVVLEAMAHGTPVVATAVGGVPELLRDGRAGRLVPAGDTAAMGRAILDTLRGGEETDHQVDRARLVVEHDHAVDVVAGRWAGLYAELTAGTPPRR